MIGNVPVSRENDDSFSRRQLVLETTAQPWKKRTTAIIREHRGNKVPTGPIVDLDDIRPSKFAAESFGPFRMQRIELQIGVVGGVSGAESLASSNQNRAALARS